MAITRDDVLKALAGVTVDAAGTSLPASGRLSEIVIDPTGRVVFSIGIAPPEAKAFEEFGAHRVYGRIPAFNMPAKKAVTWQGWRHEGTMRQHIRRPDGTLIDCEIWGITRDGWRERWSVPE